MDLLEQSTYPGKAFINSKLEHAPRESPTPFKSKYQGKNIT